MTIVKRPSTLRSSQFFLFLIASCAFMSGASAHAFEPLANVTQLSAGAMHVCALTASGHVKCWGSNLYGQVGGQYSKAAPVAREVPGVSNAVAISAGYVHACAVTAAGGVKCWGNNENGQLGSGGAAVRGLPARDVLGLSANISSVAAGNKHTCAVTSTGNVKCWGANDAGQLGDGSTTPRTAPVDVVGLSGVTAIAAGVDHTCALTASGGVKCWGANYAGQLGNGATVQSSAPVDATGLSSGVVVLAASAAYAGTCAINVAGAAKCWPSATGGIPADVAGLEAGVTAISSNCAIVNGLVKCFGSNLYGEVGDGAVRYEKASHVAVLGIGVGATAVANGTAMSCALIAGGVKCWGANGDGYQIGDGTTSDHPLPIVIPGLESGVAAIDAGGSLECAVTTSGGAKCMGANYAGQMGDGSDLQPASATNVSGLSSGVASISVGTFHACAVTTGGAVKCWGSLYASSSKIPQDVPTLSSGIASVSAGRAHTCIVTLSGGAKCWGSNQYGQLGDNTTTDAPSPVDVMGLTSGVAQISASETHTCALLTTGAVKCWGDNANGRLGSGTTASPRLAPVNVVGLSGGVQSIATGFTGSCALLANGSVKCWGAAMGQETFAPVAVAGLESGIAAIAMGQHACFLTSTGVVKCKGLLGNDEAGKGASDVPGITNAVSVSAGSVHSCALLATGAVQCWGVNRYGQLGPSGVVAQPVPSIVLAAPLLAAKRSDFDGNGRAEILWHNVSSGVMYQMDRDTAGTLTGAVIDTAPNLDWKVAGVGDLDGDGRADVVWRNPVTGEVYGLLMDGFAVVAEGTIYTEPNTAWTIEQIADLDGDGKADLVWRNGVTGEVYVMKMNGLAVAAGQVVYSEPNLNWKIVASGDLDGDGKADLLWRNQATGDVFAMLMNGFTVLSGGVIYSEPNTNWKIVGLADFDANGKADVLWQNTVTGDVYEMRMNGTAVASGAVIYSESNQNWKIVALGDYDGDGNADLLWRNLQTGQVYLMRMNGFSLLSGAFIYAEPDTNWQIVGP